MEKMYVEIGNLNDMIYEVVEKLIDQGMTVRQMSEVLGKEVNWFHKQNQYWGFDFPKSDYKLDGYVTGRKAMFDEATKLLIRERRLNLEPIEDLAKEYQCSVRTIQRICKGITVPYYMVTITEERIKEAQRLHRSGAYSIRKLSNIFEVSFGTMKKLLDGNYVVKVEETTEIC